MKKAFIFLFLSFYLFNTSFSQSEYNSSGNTSQKKINTKQEISFKDRLVLGGTLGFGMSSGGMNLGIAPLVGYKLNDRFIVGVGAGINYLRYKKTISVPNLYSGVKYMDETYTILSGSAWAQYLLFSNIYIHGEFEVNTWNYYYKPSNGYDYDRDGWAIIPKKRIVVPSLLLGAGIMQPVTDNISMYFGILYDVLQESTKNSDGIKQSPYADQIDFRMGVHLGL